MSYSLSLKEIEQYSKEILGGVTYRGNRVPIVEVGKKYGVMLTTIERQKKYAIVLLSTSKSITVISTDIILVRILIAYNIAVNHLYGKRFLTEQEYLKASSKDTLIPTESDAYRIALHILVPEDSLCEALRNRGLTRHCENSRVRELAHEFVVTPVDMENRLRYRGE